MTQQVETRESARSVLYGSFAVPFELGATPEAVFAAYADQDLRTRWFRLPGAPESRHYELDFRVGGQEIARASFAPAGVPGTEELMEYHSVFLDIVPDRRIVRAVRFALDGVPRWASLITVEFAAAAGGTRLTHTEQYSFLAWTGDGSQDVAHLKGGTRLQLNGLAAVVGGSSRL
jgi:uncharacterized protein YndB with AHSA1/START domain